MTYPKYWQPHQHRLDSSSTSSQLHQPNHSKWNSCFTYLGSIIDQQGWTAADVKARTGKQGLPSIQFKKIWTSGDLTLTTKIWLFNSNVKSLLLYRAETWRTSKTSNSKNPDILDIISIINLTYLNLTSIYKGRDVPNPSRGRNKKRWC